MTTPDTGDDSATNQSDKSNTPWQLVIFAVAIGIPLTLRAGNCVARQHLEEDLQHLVDSGKIPPQNTHNTAEKSPPALPQDNRSMGLPSNFAEKTHDKPGHKLVKEHYPSGQLKTHGYINSSGQKISKWTSWHENGQINEEVSHTTPYTNSSRVNGYVKKWHPNGTLMTEGAVKNGKREGPMTVYSPEGVKSAELNFKQGVYHGQIAAWYPSGQRWYQGTAENGKKEGLFRFWNEDGSLNQDLSGSYSNDAKIR